jgi:His/Glu/Gln/Arg/opine family amino acid ABC transporter permease subunit
MWDFLTKQIFIGELIYAARWPLYMTALAMPLAIFFGLILALMRLSRTRSLSWPAVVYIEIMRGTPLYVQLFIIFFSLPQIGELIGAQELLTLNPFPAAVLCLAANYAAYEAEIHRAGLLAVDKGQREAALSIGMSESQAFFRVTLPQAFRIILPPVINDSIAMLKDSCLAHAIGVMELLSVAESIGRNSRTLTHAQAKMYIAAGILYMILSLACYFFGKFIESKLKARAGEELHVEQARH